MLAALPCVRSGGREIEVIRRYGFLTFPEFLDNFYVRHKRAVFDRFWRLLAECGDEVRFAVFPDYRYDLAWLTEKFPGINWIFPVHSRREFDFARRFEWVGFPYREGFRDYRLGEFLRAFADKRRWFLGFWDESRPEILLRFDGFDTTLPEYYAGKCGKIWVSWGKSEKPKREMKTIEILEVNVRNLRRAIDALKYTPIDGFTAPGGGQR